MNAATSGVVASVFMFVLGLGLGMVMQVLVLAVQNAVDYHDLGVATSGATLFRSIGGSVGTAILGSIFSSRLTSQLHSLLPATVSGRVSGGSIGANPAALDRLPAPIHTAYITAFTNALGSVFVVAAVVSGAAFALSWLLPQRPLRDSVAAGAGVGEALAMPKHTDSQAEFARALTSLVGREGRRRLVERLAERAGVSLSPAACWLVVRLAEDPEADIEALRESYDIPADVGAAALQELREQGMVLGQTVTPAGAAAAERLVAERRASLARLCDGWSPEQYADLAGLLTRLARELAREPDKALSAQASA
jgi:hypothetical protein